ncbi:DUF3302 domain-containing protein [Rhodopirellula sallentina]|uniref:Putative membrane protein n=1 Tax=Rhodopirellula sallentina SM41 TaxID=1263870 RepID=M5UCX1_9BACT|nr:DUF3302 domain-containing protein [Rhodopirellula sallentina]EMI53858.1 putative membrane protein [Rhodopirellula sallentina SM41]
MAYQFAGAGPLLRIVALVFLFVFVLVAVAVLVGIAALPGRIASKRNHPQLAAVNICGWFGLPTGVLWVVAIVWAYWDYSATPLHGDSGGDSGSDSDAGSITQSTHDEQLRRKIDALEASVAKLQNAAGGQS